MAILGGFKKMIKGWLEIHDSPTTVITIEEKLNFDTNCIKNKLWMRGDPSELEQFYKQIYNQDAMFWGMVPYIKIRKIHLGIPEIMVSTLTSIVLNDLNGIELNERGNEWEEISKDNKFNDLLESAIGKALYLGDGAFKISYDKTTSEYPIIEFFGADDIDIINKRGRFKECVFKTKYTYKEKNYVLYETYGFGYIKNKLFRMPEQKEVPLESIPFTKDLKDYKFAGYNEDKNGTPISKGKFCMAIPFMIFKSPKWEGRGKSIFDGKEGPFDAVDETISQWMDAVRSGRTNKYIPKSLLPRNPETGYVLNPNDFDNRFIVTESDMGENSKNEIKITQPVIPSESYLQAYVTALDAALQGIISPSTIGIDVKKLDNAEAQREKEKATLYTRNKIIDAISECIPILINNVLKTYSLYTEKKVCDDLSVTVSFGEYANPSFEATVETVAKAKQGGIMSIETSVDELYGDSKDEKWKKEEVKRLKVEQGIEELEEPLIPNVGDMA